MGKGNFLELANVEMNAKVLNIIDEFIIYMDRDFNIKWVNKAAQDYFSTSQQEIMNNKCYSKWGFSDFCYGCPVRKAIKSKEIEEKEVEKPDGKVWFMKAFPELNEEGEVKGIVEIARDITEKKEKKELEKVSLYDPNSELPNSSNLIKRINNLIDEGIKDLHLLMIDIKNSEEIKNSIGHKRWGDFLNEFGTQLKTRQEIKFIFNKTKSRDKNTKIEVYNIYHNKIGFLLVNLNGIRLNDFIQEIKEIIDLPFYYNYIPVFQNYHLGLASYRKGDYGEELLQNANKAMNAAVRENKKMKIYEKNLETKSRENFMLLGEVKNALSENKFKLYYMPKINLSSREIVGVEALIRWHHAKYGSISPGRFIPPVEKTGLIDELSLWVMNNAAREKVFFEKSGIDVDIAVNISANNLKQKYFVEEVKNIITENNLTPGQFELELTETEIMEEITGRNDTFNLLLEEGFKIAMDDFGTGYSSLAYLKNLDIDTIKIDLSFVQAMEGDNKSYEIVKTAIRLGKILDKEVVAEGIESKKVMEELNKLGCDYGQGFYICKPVPREEFVKFYKKWQE